MSSPEQPGSEPTSPKPETGKEQEKKRDIYNLINLFKFIFCRKKSNWRWAVFIGFGGYCTYGAALYYNNPHTLIVLKVIIFMLLVGAMFTAFAARQFALNFGHAEWANPAWWITFIGYSLLAAGTLYIEPRPVQKPEPAQGPDCANHQHDMAAAGIVGNHQFVGGYKLY